MVLRVATAAALALCMFVTQGDADADTGASELVNSINAQAFADVKDLYDGVHGQVVVSPLLRASVRLIVRAGGPTPPSGDEAAAFVALIHAISSVPATSFGSRIWVDNVGTTYDSSSERLEQSIGVDTVTLHWDLNQAGQAPVDALMDRWLIEHDVGSASDPKPTGQIVKAMDAAAYFQKPSSHPFNTLSYLRRTAAFRALRTDARGLVRLPTYNQDGVRGLRLDSVDGMTAVYLFHGNSPAIVRLQTSLSIKRWKTIVGSFQHTLVPTPHLKLEAEEDFVFEPLTNQAFGTWLNKPLIRSAVERVRMSLNQREFSLSAIAGVEGVAGDNLFLHVDTGGYSPFAQISAEEPLFCVVTDSTGAILIVASSYQGNLNWQ